MKIYKIKVKNYRLLENFELDVEDDLSLIIGKNNSGKTSLLSILNKFLYDKVPANKFSCDDFNINFQKHLKQIVESTSEADKVAFLGISLKLFIKYDKTDNLSNISKFFMDLDPDNTTVVLAFEYALVKDDYNKFKLAFREFESEQKKEITAKPETENPVISGKKKSSVNNLFYDFLQDNHSKFFKITKKTVSFDQTTQLEDDNKYIDLLKEKILLDKILNFKVISAKRDVSNRENDKTLSVLSSKYYEKRENLEKESEAIQKFKKTLNETDKHLDKVYEKLFKDIIEKVEKFGGIRPRDSMIKIISTLQHKELLKDNTTVKYDHNEEHSLPEHYNGLGYMNLIGIIFEIEVLLTDFRKENKETENPADINLLFIEEPEAHTHPQMQYVFIKNIKDILNTASSGDNGTGVSFNLQTIITTHSSHITAESSFNDIKYFYKEGKNEVIAKNLRDLEEMYVNDGQIENYKFLKQYLTLNRAELFFADKAIFIEGETERILIPAMMKKLDQESEENPLLSQNISIVEVGNYSHIFEKFIDFIGIKSLIITDIDSAKEIVKEGKDGSAKETHEKCRVAEATITTNAALKFFHGDKNKIEYFKSLSIDDKILNKKVGTKEWVSDKSGKILIVYQIEEENSLNEKYYPRSFEDAFFHLNKDLLNNPYSPFDSLTKTKLKRFINKEIDVYVFSDEGIKSKPSLAMEILLNSKTDNKGKQFANWEIPEYIKEGLVWLKND